MLRSVLNPRINSLLGVVDTSLLEDLTNNGDRRVHGVRDDEHVSLGGDLGSGLGEVTDDGGVRLRVWEGAYKV